MPLKLLWIANMGYSCSFNAVSELFVRYIREYSNIDLYIFCTGIGTRSINLSEYIKYMPLDKIYTIDSLDNPNRNMTDKDQIDYEMNYFHGVLKINEILLKIKPDIIIQLNDSHLTSKMHESIMPEYRDRFIPYIPFDMDIFSGSSIPQSKYIMTTTKFAKKELEKMGFKSHIFETYHIVSGFAPVDKMVARKAFNLPTDKFIVGSININHVRKKWDILFEAFSRFEKGKRDVLLVIKTHTLIPDKPSEYNSVPGDLYNMPEMFEKYGIKNKVVVVEGTIDKERLNLLYNCFDLGLYTTSGEGWGMTPMENALCGIPSILPNNTTFTELFTKCECLIDTYNVPAIIGRTLNHNMFENSYICLFKVYKSWKTSKRSKYILNLTSDISTIVVSPFWQSKANPINMPLKIIGHYRSFEEALMHYKEARSINIDRFQILICTQRDFLRDNLKQIHAFNKMFDAAAESDLDTLVKYSYQYTNGDRIEELAGDKFGVVKLPYVNRIITKLELLYKNRDLCKSIGDRMRAAVVESCSPKRIIEELVDNIEKIEKLNTSGIL